MHAHGFMLRQELVLFWSEAERKGGGEKRFRFLFRFFAGLPIGCEVMKRVVRKRFLFPICTHSRAKQNGERGLPLKCKFFIYFVLAEALLRAFQRLPLGMPSF